MKKSSYSAVEGSNIQTSYSSQPRVSCTQESVGCSKAVAENNSHSNSNGVISGPGTGSIPVDETSSGSYLGLKIPGDTGIQHNFKK